MNEWATREGRASFAERSRVSTFVPDPFAHPLARFFGYVWRFGMIAIIGLLVYWYLFRSHLGSGVFAKRFAEQVKSTIGADTAEISNLSWDGGQASARQFAATGGAGSFFRSLKASEVSFRVPFSMYWQPEWRLNRIDAVSLQVDFRSGSLNAPTAGPVAVEEAPIPEEFSQPVLSAPGADLSLDADAADPAVAPPPPARDPRALDLKLRTDGLDVAPKFSRLLIGGIKAGRFAASWGGTDETRGDLLDASLWASREPDGSWTIDVPAGTLNQNWLRGLKLTNLKARYAGNILTVANTQVQIGEVTAELGGRIRCEEVPVFELALLARDLPLEGFCGDPFDRFFDLKGSGTLKIGGSTNVATGITVDATLETPSGSIRGLAIQQALATATSRIRFREFEITGGTVQFSTGAGRLQVKSFALTSRNDIALRGAFAYEKSEFSGEIQLGVDPVLLQKLTPEVRDRFFPETEGGKQWMTVPLQGGVERLTSALARELNAAHAAATDKP